MSVLEATVEKLKKLPPQKVEAVAAFIDHLAHDERSRFDDLFGCLSGEEADRLEHAIDESSERIETTDRRW